MDLPPSTRGRSNVGSDQSGDTRPELDGWALSGAAAGVPAFGLQLVFPELRPEAVAPTEGVPLVLGRDGDGDGRLSGTEISRRHAELRASGGQLILRDLDSSNGLFVNGAPRPGGALVAGDVVRMGEWVGVVVPLEVGAPPEPDLGVFLDNLHLGPIARSVAVRAAGLARSGHPVVLEGETGTGKERFARAIHEWSERPGPFVAVDCAALSEPLVEAALFGDPGSSLFLDEVTSVPPALQARLLEALDAPGAVRILAATRIPLHRAAAAGLFRWDLQARLDPYAFRLPPLRERRADVPSLFLHLLAQHGLTAPELSTRLVEALCAYHWPFNVRELDHLAQQLALLHGEEPLFRRAHLPDRIRYFASGGQPPSPTPAPVPEPVPEPVLETGRQRGSRVATSISGPTRYQR